MVPDPERSAATGQGKDMDRWLGDGGMPAISAFGASFARYGVDGGTGGWAEATWVPQALACNPHGAVQAGVHAVVLDAAMNFAVNAALPRGDRARATIEMKTELMRPAKEGDVLAVRGDVTRLARLIAFAEATVHDAAGQMIARATGTFLLHRRD